MFYGSWSFCDQCENEKMVKRISFLGDQCGNGNKPVAYIWVYILYMFLRVMFATNMKQCEGIMLLGVDLFACMWSLVRGTLGLVHKYLCDCNIE